MTNEHHKYKPGSRFDVFYNPDDGGVPRSTAGTVVGVFDAKDLSGFDVFQVEFTDPRTGRLRQDLFASMHLPPEERDGLIAMVERLKVERGLVKGAAQ